MKKKGVAMGEQYALLLAEVSSKPHVTPRDTVGNDFLGEQSTMG